MSLVIKTTEEIPTGAIAFSTITHENSVADITWSIHEKNREIEDVYSGGG